MAQLVARFHGMEEVGGSNPPSSTENLDIRFRMSIFLLQEQGWRLASHNIGSREDILGA